MANGNIYNTFTLDTTGGGVKVNYKIAAMGLLIVVNAKEQDYLYKYLIDQYTKDLLNLYANKSKEAVTVIIKNKVNTSPQSVDSFWQYLYKKLGAESNFTFNAGLSQFPKWYVYLDTFDHFMANSGITTTYIENEVTEFLARTLLPNEDYVPTAEEIQTRKNEKDAADLKLLSDQKSANALNQSGLDSTLSSTTQSYSKYLIIGGILLIGFYFYKQQKK
ncbi:MAG TPA: hypothetical protein VIK86_07080 [Candidatus Paceibacterota bacterium]